MNKKLKTLVLAGVIIVVAVGATHVSCYITNTIKENQAQEAQKELTKEEKLQMLTLELVDMYHDDRSYISASENTYGLNIVKFNIVDNDINVMPGYDKSIQNKMDSKLNELRKGLSYLYFNHGGGLKPKIYINLYDTNGLLVDTVNGIYNEYTDDKDKVDLKWLSEFKLDLYNK